MAVATQEAAIEQVNAQLQTWRMPRPAPGDRVIWFQGVGADQSRGCVAIVSHVDPNYVELVTLGRNQHLQCKKQARHVSDPRLVIGEDWLVYGTWDFLPASETDRSLLGRLEDMSLRLLAFEQKVARVEDTLITAQKEITNLQATNAELKKQLAKQAQAPAEKK